MYLRQMTYKYIIREETVVSMTPECRFPLKQNLGFLYIGTAVSTLRNYGVKPPGILNGKELNWKERIKNCYLVMQDVNHQLFTESVLEEILLSMENYADNESVKKANAIKILKALNLEKFQEVHPMSLSGGQKQRVSVACALASDKKILVYDEPTSGLDYTRMLDVAEAIKSMQKRGRTQFVITHDPELIEKCCDYVMFMDKGGVIDVGTIEEERLHRIKKFFRV